MSEINIYTRRPDGTALWLPASLCKNLNIMQGDQLTDDQFSSLEICDLIAHRKDSQKNKRNE